MTHLLAVTLAGAAQTLVLPPHSLPPGAMQPQRTARGPVERRSVQSYFTALDYPPEAAGKAGRVQFTVTISPDGRVIGCTITRSSGSAALDATTCRIVERRARYAPAVDSNGNPEVGTIDQEMDWNAP